MIKEFLKLAYEQGHLTIEQLGELTLLAEMQEKEEVQENGFSLNLTNILWVGGAAIIISALILLADNISKKSYLLLHILFCIYAVGFFILDIATKRKIYIPLLSSVLKIAIGFCLVGAISTWQYLSKYQEYFLSGYSKNLISVEQPIYIPAYGMGMNGWLLYSAILPSILILVLGFYLLKRSNFLPSWCLIIFSIFAIGLEIFYRYIPDLVYADEHLKWYIVVFGALAYIIGWKQDLSSPINHGFWLNKIGMIIFSFGMVLFFEENSNLNKWLFLLICIFAISLSIFQRRPSGISFGALGIFAFIDWQFDFQDSDLLLVLVVTLIGVFTIGIGILAKKYEANLDNHLPKSIKSLRPIQRDDPVTFGF